MLLAASIAFGFVFLASRRVQLVPGSRLQGLAEVVIEFVDNEFATGMIGKEGRKWLPFFGTLFLFIFFMNVVGLVPGLYTATSSISVTGTLAFLIVFPTVHIVGMRRHGIAKYWWGLVPRGVPIALAPFLFLIELIGTLAKPLSLMIRLFANMFAGHLILFTFLGMIIEFQSLIIAPMPLIGAVVMSALEILFSGIQAFIFTILSAMYVNDALHGGH